MLPFGKPLFFETPLKQPPQQCISDPLKAVKYGIFRASAPAKPYYRAASWNTVQLLFTCLTPTLN